MKRKIKIILIIISLILLALLGAWLWSRKQATKNNVTPPTFRAFLGIGTSAKPSKKQTTSNELTSDFTNDGKTDTESSSSTNNTSATSPVRSSIFTNSGFSPIQGTNTLLQDSGSGWNNITNSPQGGGVGGGGGVGTGGSGVVVLPPSNQPECSEADVSIEFTTAEIDRLNALKSRFFALTSSLNTDTELATEVENYDVFKSKSDKLTELYNYCKQSPVYTLAKPTIPPSCSGISLLTPSGLTSSGCISTTRSEPYGHSFTGPNGATINYRVPTPFWHDLTKDNQAFVHQGVNFAGIFSDPDLIFPERSIEHALRLNLW